jgi:hypothetical protein
VTGSDAVGGLVKLKAKERTTGDRQYRLVCECGTYLGFTKMSRNVGSQTLGDNLESLMARQLGITSSLWRSIAGCQKGLREFLTAHGHWHKT